MLTANHWTVHGVLNRGVKGLKELNGIATPGFSSPYPLWGENEPLDIDSKQQETLDIDSKQQEAQNMGLVLCHLTL